MLAGACALSALGVAHAQERPYAPESEAWDGLSRLVEIAAEHHIPLEVPSELDLGSLTREDALVILYPSESLPASLGGFMAEGGRVAVADDFGEAGSFLRIFGITRVPVSAEGLRGNPNLPIAAPRGAHPITAGVSALVTNHPTALAHPELVPVFALGEADAAVVLAGAVGSGRLIVIGDPSLLINNMMQFRGNERFALNLLQYLKSGNGSGRVFLMTPGSVVHGRFGTLNADRPLERTRLSLERAGALELPDLMVRGVAAAIAAILLIFAASALPKQSPYQRSIFLPVEGRATGGTGGRLALLRAEDDALSAALAYRFELLVELRRRLSLHPDTDGPNVLRALQVRLAPQAADEAAALLGRLDRLWVQVDVRGRTPRLRRAALASMVKGGEALLGGLPDPAAATAPRPAPTPLEDAG
ncbi:MAG: hypothetical protein KC668_23840 [Myxococcales bacterium]|nr:hypothetical protein [Myxococcales bacterium]